MISVSKSLRLSILRKSSGISPQGFLNLMSTVQSQNIKHLKDLTKNLDVGHSKLSPTTVERFCKEFRQTYQLLNSEESTEFLLYLAPSSKVDRSTVNQAASKFINSSANSNIERLQDDLKQALEPPINQLFSKIGQTRGGVKFLVDMRRDIIETLKSIEPGTTQHKNLTELSKNLKSLLSMWISVGFMSLSRVTWESPSALLEKISGYEAVHPLRSWTDLKSRVGPYRRVFVYTHPCMLGEPLVVLHVQLTTEISKSMEKVLKEFRSVSNYNRPDDRPVFLDSEEDIGSVDTAIFYSITSSQQGLQGIELGTHLIKQAVAELQKELPNLRRFSTLSPIPGFRTWLLLELTRHIRDQGQSPLKLEEERILQAVSENESGAEFLFSQVKQGSWIGDQELVAVLKPILLRLCARYLYAEKRRSKALDPVANFHIRNGSVLYRINWLADPSPRGMTNSCGMMVNYRYFLENVEENSSQYMMNNKIAVDEQVLDMLGSER